MLVIDGLSTPRGVRNVVWALPLAGAPVWSVLQPAGPAPPARHSHCAAYDPVRERVLLFGGFTGTEFAGDLWALSLGSSPTWTRIAESGSGPPGRDAAAMIYNPVGDRLVLFGGWSGTGYLDDLLGVSALEFHRMDPARGERYAAGAHARHVGDVRPRQPPHAGLRRQLGTPGVAVRVLCAVAGRESSVERIRGLRRSRPLRAHGGLRLARAVHGGPRGSAWPRSLSAERHVDLLRADGPLADAPGAESAGGESARTIQSRRGLRSCQGPHPDSGRAGPGAGAEDRSLGARSGHRSPPGGR